MKEEFHDQLTMDAMMRRWPATIRVVLDHGMLCVGCPIAPFHTIADAAREHDTDPVALTEALKKAAADGGAAHLPGVRPSSRRSS